MKRVLAIILSVLCVMSLASCGKTSTEAVEMDEGLLSGVPESDQLLGSVGSGESQDVLEITSTVLEDKKFGAATVSLSQRDFESAGFVLGDSCDVEFGNGYSLTDIPYYNGYYVNPGDPVIVAYPGAARISVTLNLTGIWSQAGLTNGDSIVIRLNEAGKYAEVQEILGQEYSADRSKYASDIEFCNFRALTGGDLKEGLLYRGASPADNARKRAPYTDGILSEYGIQNIIDLADSKEDIEGYFADENYNSPYFRSLYEDGRVAYLDMNADYLSDKYRQAVAQGFKSILGCEGPIYIHCQEGKDRTGFVCTLIEALAGASYEEMRRDYMITYGNYYSITYEDTPEKYDIVADLYFHGFTECLLETEEVRLFKTGNYVQGAANYLKSGGMTDEEVEQLRKFITGEE